MARRVAIGAQGFAYLREHNAFLVDKTGFLSDWWQSLDVVTLVCRPRRFGKTLTLSMADCFFSTRYAGREDLFEGLDVWEDPTMRSEQGTWPVVYLSFAGVKGPTFESLQARLCELVAQAYRDHRGEVDLGEVGERERRIFTGKDLAVPSEEVPASLARLCEILSTQLGKRAIVLLDEYDTPLQEAWVDGCWERMVDVMRPLFNATLKSNPYLERALITGITRVARESIFSDLNNLKIVTTTSHSFETAFGFTQGEVDDALEEFGLSDREGVRRWYDGFQFGDVANIYNPWSITNYLDERKLAAYWANTSSNGLVSTLVSRSDPQLKADFETLLEGGTVEEYIDEQVSFPDLERDPSAVWSLLVASGYLKILSSDPTGDLPATLAITNYETMVSFDAMVRRWFAPSRVAYNGFVKALLAGDLKAMNAYMNDVALNTFSTFDAGNRPSGAEPERFYHGFVLGLLVGLRGRYLVRSNRESGYGRYDVMLVPADAAHDPGIVMEFKVRDSDTEASLDQTVVAAKEQIEERAYAAELIEAGVPADHVRAYGFAFEGKRVLIG